MAVTPFISSQPPYPDVYGVQKKERASMFAPPLNLSESNSGGAAQPVAKAQAPVGFAKDATSPYSLDPAKMTGGQRTAMAGLYGAQAASQVPATESGVGAAAGAVGAAAQGAAMGFMAGGPMGAAVGGGVGLLMGGLNAFIGNQQARKERDRINSMNREASRLQKEAIARDEKWRQTYRLDSLEDARYQRRKYEAQAAYERSQNTGKSMLAKIQANSAIKDKYAKMGWF